MNSSTPYENTTAFVRAYSYPVDGRNPRKRTGASEQEEPHVYRGQTLTFDCETLRTPDKALLYGVFTLMGYSKDELQYKHVDMKNRDALRVVGIFYSDELTAEEIKTLHTYADSLSVEDIAARLAVPADSLLPKVQVWHVDKFNKWLYKQFRDNDVLVVGLNLPFDISRLAYDWYEPRGKDTGSFALVLCKDGKHCNEHPAIQIRHVGFAKPIFSLAKTHYTNRHSGKRIQSKWFNDVRFVDCMTLSGALLGKAMGLEKLGDTLNIAPELRKKDRPNDYRPNLETLTYATTDVLATFACFQKLREVYERHGLSTPIWHMYSGASLGKAYLKDIGIRPFMETHPDFPGDVIGYAMNAYYGGRSEVHYRLIPGLGNLRDFTGLYPTVNALMGLQRYWLAKEIQVNRNAKEWVQELLNTPVDELLEFLHSKAFWLKMPVLVQVLPDGDRLPIRASFDGEEISTNIALPYVKSDVPLWYTLSDVIASKLMSGHTPHVLQAIELVPSDATYETRPITVMGQEKIDLLSDDFFTRIGDLRQHYKKLMKEDTAKSDYYDSIQTALKLLQNSTSYGIQVQIDQREETLQDETENHEAQKRDFTVHFFKTDGNEYMTVATKQEKTGTYFSPLGVFIPGAARLMLAIAEKLYSNAGMTYGFMDTDSVFVLQPETMSMDTFAAKEQEVASWFQALSPYHDKDTPMFKLEHKNVWLFAVSAKRYALYRKDKTTGEIELVKVSSHGLGAVSRPYGNDVHYFPECPKEYHVEGVNRWVCDVWYKAIRAIEQGTMIDGNLTLPRVGATQEPRLGERWLPFRMPAMHQITITTPHLLKTYGDIPGARPYNFFTMLRAVPGSKVFQYTKNMSDDEREKYEYLYELASKGVTFYTGSTDPDNLEQVRRSDTHALVEPWVSFTTVAQSLHEYFSHPESKAKEPHGIGILYPRSVQVTDIRYIGKEVTDVLEEIQEDADSAFTEEIYLPVEYRERDVGLVQALRVYNVSDVMLVSGIPRNTVYRVLTGRITPHPTTLYRLSDALKTLEENKQVGIWHNWPVKRLARVARVSMPRAQALVGGQVSFTADERKRILRTIEKEQAS